MDDFIGEINALENGGFNYKDTKGKNFDIGQNHEDETIVVMILTNEGHIGDQNETPEQIPVNGD